MATGPEATSPPGSAAFVAGSVNDSPSVPRDAAISERQYRNPGDAADVKATAKRSPFLLSAAWPVVPHDARAKFVHLTSTRHAARPPHR